MEHFRTTKRGATPLGVALTIIILILIAGGIFYLLPSTPPTSVDTGTPTTTNPVASTTPLTSYMSDQYHFSIEYPQNLEATSTFNGYQHVATSWRQGAVDTPKSGTPVVSIIVDSLMNNPGEEGYYYDAELRIGVSTTASAVTNCLTVDADEDSATTSIAVGGITFTHFTRESAGMSQFGKVDSYRTVHNKTCVAVEAIIAGGGTALNNPSQSPERAATDKQMMQSILQTFAFTD